MIRTQKEWWNWCMERGTSGGLMFDILSDWEEEKILLKNFCKELEQRKEEGIVITKIDTVLNVMKKLF